LWSQKNKRTEFNHKIIFSKKRDEDLQPSFFIDCRQLNTPKHFNKKNWISKVWNFVSWFFRNQLLYSCYPYWYFCDACAVWIILRSWEYWISLNYWYYFLLENLSLPKTPIICKYTIQNFLGREILFLLRIKHIDSLILYWNSNNTYLGQI